MSLKSHASEPVTGSGRTGDRCAAVQWTMNSCLAAIGIHSPAHRPRAIAIGEILCVYCNYPVSKNESCKVARLSALSPVSRIGSASFFICEVLDDKLGFEVRNESVPEFPVRIGSIEQRKPRNKSFEVVYLALSTDGRSRSLEF